LLESISCHHRNGWAAFAVIPLNNHTAMLLGLPIANVVNAAAWAEPPATTANQWHRFCQSPSPA